MTEQTARAEDEAATPPRLRADAAAPQPVPSTALEREHAEMKDRLLRTLAEMENLRKRTDARSRRFAALRASTSFARDVLGVADNMRRALEAVAPEVRASAQAGMQGADRRRRADRTRTAEGAGKERRAPVHAAGREIRPQCAPGHVRGARCIGAGRQHRPGRAARLHDRRARVAAGLGRGVERRPEGRAGFIASNDNSDAAAQRS